MQYLRKLNLWGNKVRRYQGVIKSRKSIENDKFIWMFKRKKKDMDQHNSQMLKNGQHETQEKFGVELL